VPEAGGSLGIFAIGLFNASSRAVQRVHISYSVLWQFVCLCVLEGNADDGMMAAYVSVFSLSYEY